MMPSPQPNFTMMPHILRLIIPLFKAKNYQTIYGFKDATNSLAHPTKPWLTDVKTCGRPPLRNWCLHHPPWLKSTSCVLDLYQGPDAIAILLNLSNTIFIFAPFSLALYPKPPHPPLIILSPYRHEPLFYIISSRALLDLHPLEFYHRPKNHVDHYASEAMRQKTQDIHDTWSRWRHISTWSSRLKHQKWLNIDRQESTWTSTILGIMIFMCPCAWSTLAGLKHEGKMSRTSSRIQFNVPVREALKLF